jgi:nucleotide-binding universal stress UspA family protein
MDVYKILVPIDFSESSKKALDLAALLAEKFKAELILLNIFELKKSYYDNEGIGNTIVLAKDIKDEKIEKLKELAILKGIAKRVTLEYVAETGSFVKKLQEIISQHSIDFIVMGTQGADDLNNYLFGSDAISVLKHVSQLLAVVPEKSSVTGLKNIAFASDFQIEELEPILFMAKIASLFNANLHIVHVGVQNIEKEENRVLNFKKLIDKNLPEISPTYHLFYKDTILDGLVDFAQKNQIDLFGINHHASKNFLEDILNPSLTKDLEMYNNSPLLIFSA